MLPKVPLRDLNAAPGEGLQYDVNYQWDHHNQLAAVKSPAGTFTYAYDERNPALLTKLTGPAHETTTTWEPDRNLITSIANTAEHPAGTNQSPSESISGSTPAKNPAYDLDGNLVSDHRNTYTWNAENRLSRVQSKDGKTRVDYHYDYQGRRTIKQTFSRAKATENFKLKTSNFSIYDGWNLLAEVESSALETENLKLKTSYHTWGRDLSGTLQGAGGVGGLLAITETTEPLGANEEKNPKSKIQNQISETKFPLYDANGNVGQMIDSEGDIVAAYTYDPFGNVTEMVGEHAAENPWRFSTKPVEEETGWSYYGFRYYVPTEGRWASRDPITERGGVNLYGFVGNDGITQWDLVGLTDAQEVEGGFHVKRGVKFEGAYAGLTAGSSDEFIGYEIWFEGDDGCCENGTIKVIQAIQYNYPGPFNSDSVIDTTAELQRENERQPVGQPIPIPSQIDSDAVWGKFTAKGGYKDAPGWGSRSAFFVEVCAVCRDKETREDEFLGCITFEYKAKKKKEGLMSNLKGYGEAKTSGSVRILRGASTPSEVFSEAIEWWQAMPKGKPR